MKVRLNHVVEFSGKRVMFDVQKRVWRIVFAANEGAVLDFKINRLLSLPPAPTVSMYLFTSYGIN